MKGRLLTPYQGAALGYSEAGWSPVPVLEKNKSPVMVGVTGWKAGPIEQERVREWIQPSFRAPTQTSFTFTPGNIALHLDEGFIGIDVDAYGKHDGAATLARAEAAWGPLPATWVTHSSRGDGSGIRIYRMPKDLKLPNNLSKTHGDGVDIVHTGHRYVMCWPSIHDEGRPYAWTKPDGEPAEPGEIPATSDIPKLPKRWVAGLTNGERRGKMSASDPIGYEEAVDWVMGLGREPSMCTTMKATLKTWQQRVMAAGGGGFHDAARDGVWAILRDARDGHQGVVAALNKLKKTFGVGVESDRDKKRTRLSEGEWQRMICGGVPRLIAEDEATDVQDPCIALAEGVITRKDKTGKILESIELSERGNADRLAEVVDGRLRYLEDQRAWIVWDEETGLWRESEIQPERWAVKAVDLLEGMAEADEGMDPKQRTAIRGHCRTSRKPAGFHSTLDYFKGRPGVEAHSLDFDSNRHVLAVRNGLLRLGKERAEFRPLLMRDDRITLVADCDWKEGARSAEWNSFLERIQPSAEVRAWLARLVGYSLLGGNPARRFIVGMGLTTSGKGTFIGAIRAMLGQYATTTTLTIFRDNQDERPRADLADALMKRIVFMDEASHQWKLHPDQVKRMTGAGEISARRPHARSSVVRMPYFTPWLLTNGVPHIEGADGALRRRLIVVPFSETLRADEVDVELADRLTAPAVREAVLAWAIDGYNQLRAMGYEEGLATPVDAFAVRDEFTSSMSDFDAFVAKLCVTGEEFRELPQNLATAWEQWMDANQLQGRDRIRPQTFARTLNANGYMTRLFREDEKVVRYRMGLKLVDGWESLVETTLFG